MKYTQASGTICEMCFNLKNADHGEYVRCSINKFKEHLLKGHPFTTLPRSCPDFDNEEEDDQERY